MITFNDLKKYFEEHEDLAKCCIWFNNYNQLKKLYLDYNEREKNFFGETKDDDQVFELFINSLKEFVKWVLDQDPETKIKFNTYDNSMGSYINSVDDIDDEEINSDLSYMLYSNFLNSYHYYITIDGVDIYFLYRFGENFYSTEFYVESADDFNKLPCADVYSIGNYVEPTYSFYLVNQPIANAVIL